MLRTLISAFPWDLLDSGLDACLDRIQGELGAGGLSLWAAVAPQCHLRAREVDPRVFRTRGGPCFAPRAECYEATRIKPVSADFLRGQNPLEKIAEACEKRDLHLRFKIATSTLGRVAQRSPEAACKNVFGDVSPTCLCLANPDVQSFFCGLIKELHADYGLGDMALADFRIAWWDAFDIRLSGVERLWPWARTLLAICFCESCQQKAAGAGVDASAAMRSVRAILQRQFESDGEHVPSLPAILSDNQALAAFCGWRRNELGEFCRRIADGCEVRPTVTRTPNEGWAGRSEVMEPAWGDCAPFLAGVVSEIGHPDSLRSSFVADAPNNELGIAYPDTNGGSRLNGSDLVKLCSKAIEAGFVGIEIGHLGGWTEEDMTSVKQAIRYARRG